jgi:glycosyltransferase involved in cell wall biosynthesis
MKDIVVISHFSGELSNNNNDRFLYLCKELTKTNRVELITNDFSHGKKVHRETATIDLPFKSTVLHEPGYKKNTSLFRFLSHYLWGQEVKKYLQRRATPDVIYCAIPSLTASWVAAKYCQRNGSKFIIDIQDLWPEAFKMVFAVPGLSNLLFFPFQYCANKIYACADEIVAVSKQYMQKALSVNKKAAKGHVVYIGADIDKFDEGAQEAPLFSKDPGELWIGYCGTLAISYDIFNLILAVEELDKKDVGRIKLVIMGDGEYKQKFESFAAERKVNVLFTGKLPYQQMCAQLTACDIVVNPIKKGSAASIINKHGDYAASGRPVINSQESNEYRELVDYHCMGLNCNNEDAIDMAKNLEQLIVNDDLREEMGRNARRFAEEKFDRKHSYQTIIRIINE